MKLIGISQRVDIIAPYNERRDAIDQHWIMLLAAAGYQAIVLPNNKVAAERLMSTLPICGIIFSGGNDLVAYGGDAPERDEMEFSLLNYVVSNQIPSLGVCRGMQLMQHFWGISLERVAGQVIQKQRLTINGDVEVVNSFHCWGSFATRPFLDCFAISSEGVIKGIKHKKLPLQGIMWHPERIIPYRKQDVQLIKRIFS